MQSYGHPDLSLSPTITLTYPLTFWPEGPGPAIGHICTEFGVDSSSHFTFRAQTDKTESPRQLLANGVGNNTMRHYSAIYSTVMLIKLLCFRIQILGIFVIYMFITKVEDRYRLFKYRKRYYPNWTQTVLWMTGTQCWCLTGWDGSLVHHRQQALQCDVKCAMFASFTSCSLLLLWLRVVFLCTVCQLLFSR